MIAYCSSEELGVLRRKLDTAWIHAGAGAHATVAISLGLLGYREQALDHVRQAVELARELGRDEVISHAAGAVAMVHIQFRDFAQALPWTQDARQRAARAGIATFLLTSTAHEGLSRAHLGESQEGITMVRDSLAQFEARGHRSFLPGIYWYLADCYLVGGKAQEALEAAESGLCISAELGQRVCVAPMHLICGQALLLLDPTEAARAEAAMWDALDAARRQRSRLYELQSSVALARLWQGQGKVAEARALLQPVYEWFTEGFDMPDLVEARTLLAELAT